MRNLKFLLLALLTLTAACSHMTPFQACNEQDEGTYEWQKHGSIEACVEQKKIEANTPNMAQRFFGGFAQGYNQTRSQQQQNTEYTCKPSYAGSGKYNCY